MRAPILMLILSLLSSGDAIASNPEIVVAATVKRTTEFPMSEKQTRIFDEATKVSVACRTFHGLYDRWPKSVREIKDRTSDIDFAVFDKKLRIYEIPEGLLITFFDGDDERQLLASTDRPATPEQRADAQAATFKIRVSLQVLPGGGA